MAIVGIDLGTTNSLAAVYKDGRAQLVPNQFSEFLTPSVVSVDKDGRAVVGRIAQERLVTQPQDTVARFKRKMGTDAVYNLGGRRFTPEALSACVIGQLVAARSTSRWSTASTTWWASARWRAITIWAGATSTC